MKAAYLMALILSAQALQRSASALNSLEAWDSHEDGNDHHIKEAFAAEMRQNEKKNEVVEDPNSISSLLKNAKNDRKKLGVLTDEEQAL